MICRLFTLVIKCPALTAPAHGAIGACSLDYPETCSVHCVDGYVRHGGDETRTCLLHKQWSGVPPTCRGKKALHFQENRSEVFSNVPRNTQYKDVYRRTIEILQRTRIFKANCCLKVHNVSLKLVRVRCKLFYVPHSTENVP